MKKKTKTLQIRLSTFSVKVTKPEQETMSKKLNEIFHIQSGFFLT
jgi:hypothetical protein